MNRSLRLTSIRVSPQPRTTRSSFLTSALSPFLGPSPYLPSWLNPNPHPAHTLEDILMTTRNMVNHLDAFGVFNMARVDVRLEPRRGGDEDEVEMVLGLKEMGRLYLKAGTEIGGNEGGGVSTGLHSQHRTWAEGRTSLRRSGTSLEEPRRSK